MSRATSVKQPWSTTLRIFIKRLNAPWHEPALYIYTAIVLAHWVEHLVQAYQIFVLNWARPASLGALGLWAPWLVKTEILHFGYAVFMLAGLILLRPGFQGRSRFWWNISLGIQTWHFFEHFLLQSQAALHHNLFSSQVPVSLLQLWIPRVELHLIYNAIVFIPMVIAMYYHLYPPVGEPHLLCNCSRRRAPMTVAEA